MPIIKIRFFIFYCISVVVADIYVVYCYVRRMATHPFTSQLWYGQRQVKEGYLVLSAFLLEKEKLMSTSKIMYAYYFTCIYYRCCYDWRI